MKICKNCGTNNDDFAVYCTDCGILLDEKNTSVVQDELQSEKTAPVHGGAYEQKQEHKPDSEKHDSREPYKARPSENILDFDNEISMDDDSFDSYFENGNEYPDFEGIVDVSIK